MTHLQTRDDSHNLEEADQQPVFDEYHTGSGRVVVGAGAGTGKTTTLIDAVAEAVLEKLDEEDGNPMDDILLTTFTKDAASELKTKLKRRLREHEEASGETLEPELWRWIETESYIETIDSFTHTLLREIAVELGISPSFEIRDGLEDEDLYDDIMEELREDEEYAELLEMLEDAYPDLSWQAYPPNTLRQILIDTHEKRREFCWSIDEAANHFEETLRETIHQGHNPPLDENAVSDIIHELTGRGSRPSQELVDHATDVYEYNLEVVRAFGDVLREFNRLYDEKTLEEGLLSHTDITYLVWEALENEPDSDWAQSLGQRFDHVFIDEFQDTNYAQCRILSYFIENQSPRTKLMIIGDVKQSIYQWRSAEPGIFADIIEHAQSEDAGPDEYLEADGLEYLALRTNFRSHPDLVYAANHLFDAIFTDPARGAIGQFEVPFEPLLPRRRRLSSEEEQAHLYVINLGDAGNKDDWLGLEPRRVAETVSGFLNRGELQVVDEEHSDPFEDPTGRDAKPGDVTMLFQRRTHMPRYAEALRNHGVNCAIDVSAGLFAEPAIRLLIDVLDWFANPHSKNSLIRILRSPVTALSDKTLRYLASERFYLSSAMDNWPAELPDEDLKRLDNLVKLRDDLRWERESSKASLIQSIIRHTAFDAIVIGDVDGKQRYANLWLFTEVVNDWEEEELLSYGEFLTRLKRLRSRALSGDGEYNVAQIADEDSDDAVRLTTVHQSKGLEYSIVVLPDLNYPATVNPYEDRILLNRELSALHPVTRDGRTVSQGSGGGGSWINDNGAGTIWITETRNNRGDLGIPHPLNNHIRGDLAEFWRTLYVAFTRASDHIIFGSSNEDPWPNSYSTWTVAMREYLCPTDEWTDGDFDCHLGWAEDTDKMQTALWAERVAGLAIEWDVDNGQVSTTVPISVDQIDPGEYVDATPIGMNEVEAGLSADRRHEVTDVTADFMPRVLNPTSLHDLSECPLRFQYRTLQNISTMRSPVPPGSAPPGNLERDTWGDIVHSTLERYVNNEETAIEYIDQYDGDVHDELLDAILPNFNSTALASELPENDSGILPEYALTAYYAPTGTYVRGVIDLLYKTADGWHIVDYKTGRVVNEDEYSFEAYRYQLSAYVWLLRHNFENISIESVRLMYVHPDVSEENIEVDGTLFDRELDRLADRLELTEDGLIADPDPEPSADTDPDISHRCGTCPYIDRCPAWSMTAD